MLAATSPSLDRSALGSIRRIFLFRTRFLVVSKTNDYEQTVHLGVDGGRIFPRAERHGGGPWRGRRSCSTEDESDF